MVEEELDRARLPGLGVRPAPCARPTRHPERDVHHPVLHVPAAAMLSTKHEQPRRARVPLATDNVPEANATSRAALGNRCGRALSTRDAGRECHVVKLSSSAELLSELGAGACKGGFVVGRAWFLMVTP